MAGADDSDGAWETQAEVDACLRETGVTAFQVNRWRHLGLLPPAKQEPQAYRGSIVKYPVGTCLQIKTLQALFKQKNRVAYVGFRLWWQGFWVKEDYWRPRLQAAAKSFDHVLPLISRLRLRSDNDDAAPTLQDRAASLAPKNIILSRVWPRISNLGTPTFWRVLLDLGEGQFDGFEAAVRGQEKSLDEQVAIKAFDFENSENHQILGHKMNSIAVLPSALKNVSAAMSKRRFAEAANAPASEIAAARDDLRNALTIGWALYEAQKWIYGPGAFGLRFAHWIAQKLPDWAKPSMVLGMMNLRTIPDAIWPSEEIARQAAEAMKVCDQSLQLKRLWQENPKYKLVLNPKRIKAAFCDEISLRRWREEIKEISLRE